MTTGEFNLTGLERVISGPGCISQLGNELERRNLQRAIIVTGKSLGESPLLDQLTTSAGTRCAAVFRGVRQHVPWSAVTELQAEIQRVNADCLISFGGGSPIDSAKVAIFKEVDRDLIHIAVPTTLSAGEYTPVAGVTDEATKVKSGVSDPRILPRSVINDPALTLATPDWLWASTAMRALDHAVEAAYSIRHHPLSDTLATKAISLLVANLKASMETTGAKQLEHRADCQMAAWFSIYGAMNTRFGLSHALGHQIGPRWNVPHGVTSCITLPHAMRFMAGIARERFTPITDGFGVRSAGESATRAAEFIAGFGVPTRLRDAGVPQNEATSIAETVAHEVNKSQVIDRPVTTLEVATILKAAW
jgi:alcohol dehydrogenase